MVLQASDAFDDASGRDRLCEKCTPEILDYFTMPLIPKFLLKIDLVVELIGQPNMLFCETDVAETQGPIEMASSRSLLQITTG